MRIIAGKYKGMRIKAPKGTNTRPTSDRVKEAIFSTLSGKTENANVLDLFAGTGGLSFEAISRGAKNACLIEKNKAAYDIIMENAEKLKITDKITVFLGDVTHFFRKKEKKTGKYDLIFLDPPYYGKYYNEIITSIEEYDLLSHNGVLVAEAPKTMTAEEFETTSLTLVKTAAYGDTKIFYFQKTGVE